MLKASFNVSSEYQACQPDDRSIFDYCGIHLFQTTFLETVMTKKQLYTNLSTTKALTLTLNNGNDNFEHWICRRRYITIVSNSWYIHTPKNILMYLKSNKNSIHVLAHQRLQLTHKLKEERKYLFMEIPPDIVYEMSREFACLFCWAQPSTSRSQYISITGNGVRTHSRFWYLYSVFDLKDTSCKSIIISYWNVLRSSKNTRLYSLSRKPW